MLQKYLFYAIYHVEQFFFLKNHAKKFADRGKSITFAPALSETRRVSLVRPAPFESSRTGT